MKIGFLGLGRMGAGMARNLLRAGHDVTVYNRTRERADPFGDEGAHIAATPAEAADAEAVCTMVADDAALLQLVEGPAGLLTAMPRGSLHVSHSTVSTAAARHLTSAHALLGQSFVSAPVFGRPDAAASAQLLVVAAGRESDLLRAQPIFDAIGRRTLAAGAEPFHANAVKLCGNFMIAAMIEAFGEAFATLRKSGIDPMVFLEAVNALFRSPVYENYGKLIAEERFEPAGFALRLGLKDARLVLEAAEAVGAPMPFASLIRDQILAALSNGQEHMDWSSFTRTAARNAGLPDS